MWILFIGNKIGLVGILIGELHTNGRSDVICHFRSGVGNYHGGKLIVSYASGNVLRCDKLRKKLGLDKGQKGRLHFVFYSGVDVVVTCHAALNSFGAGNVGLGGGSCKETDRLLEIKRIVELEYVRRGVRGEINVELAVAHLIMHLGNRNTVNVLIGEDGLETGVICVDRNDCRSVGELTIKVAPVRQNLSGRIRGLVVDDTIVR